VKVAKKFCDGKNLSLVVSGFAADFVFIKVTRRSEDSFEVKAWQRIRRSQPLASK
jgi:hypothetical protein